MTPVAERLSIVWQRIASAARRAGRDPGEIRLVAVSKTRPFEAIAAAIDAGVHEFGENRAQEFRDKVPLFGPEATWHFIGRLQTNKVKYVIPGASLVHSLDRADLAHAIDRRAEQAGRDVDVLLEVNTSGEVSKGGVLPAQVRDFLEALCECRHVQVRGLMTMAAPGDPQAARASFRRLHDLRDRLRSEPIGEGLSELSMGMSDDFEIAIEEGATIVRIGTAIFGPRQ